MKLYLSIKVVVEKIAAVHSVATAKEEGLGVGRGFSHGVGSIHGRLERRVWRVDCTLGIHHGRGFDHVRRSLGHPGRGVWREDAGGGGDDIGAEMRKVCCLSAEVWHCDNFRLPCYHELRLRFPPHPRMNLTEMEHGAGRDGQD